MSCALMFLNPSTKWIHFQCQPPIMLDQKFKLSLDTFMNAMSKTSNALSSTSFQLEINSLSMFEFLPCNLQIFNVSIFVLHVLVCMDIPSTSGLIRYNCDKMFFVWNCQNIFCGWLPWMLLLEALVCGSYDIVSINVSKSPTIHLECFIRGFFKLLFLYVIPHAKTFP